MGFTDIKHPELFVHLDPEFETFTYGHVKSARGVTWKGVSKRGRFRLQII